MGFFNGQIAVVTGASSGIGNAISIGLAAQGASLCLVDRDLDGLEVAGNSAKGLSGYVSIHRADLAVDDDIRLLVAALRKDFGGIDLLIHSAGVICIGKIEQASIEDFDLQYRINVRAPYLLTQAFLPALKLRRGQVVFINSSAGLAAATGVAQYAATKHALKAVADSLRAEINADGVRVMSVYPGRTAGPMQAALHQLENKAYCSEKLLQPADVAAVVISALSLPRTAEVTDIHVRPMSKP